MATPRGRNSDFTFYNANSATRTPVSRRNEGSGASDVSLNDILESMKTFSSRMEKKLDTIADTMGEKIEELHVRVNELGNIVMDLDYKVDSLVARKETQRTPRRYIRVNKEISRKVKRIYKGFAEEEQFKLTGNNISYTSEVNRRVSGKLKTAVIDEMRAGNPNATIDMEEMEASIKTYFENQRRSAVADEEKREADGLKRKMTSRRHRLLADRKKARSDADDTFWNSVPVGIMSDEEDTPENPGVYLVRAPIWRCETVTKKLRAADDKRLIEGGHLKHGRLLGSPNKRDIPKTLINSEFVKGKCQCCDLVSDTGSETCESD